MAFLRPGAGALACAAVLAVSGCGSSSTTASNTTTAGTTSSTATVAQLRPAGAAPTDRSISAEATAKLANALGVTPTKLTAALTTARASGAGVNLVRTLSNALGVSQTTVAAGLKALGPAGP